MKKYPANYAKFADYQHFRSVSRETICAMARIAELYVYGEIIMESEKIIPQITLRSQIIYI
ncbi:hypothetical protein [Portibacter lacus]|uniref:Uncharacterized protein n=1 Tax=Portibacter lacus TaxID=1099794 RepID=A0AA37SPP5_9BACT|nr:hypothetical protein [Portibacter lacus]GLR16899.1 hypothetical protein GCM10007940_15140 [Portibacter lacus]